MTTPQPARTYNQDHVAREYSSGKRRVSIYWTWSYPWETNRDLTEMDNRFSSMTEVRRVAWPAFEASEWDKMNFAKRTQFEEWLTSYKSIRNAKNSAILVQKTNPKRTQFFDH